jgi:hypothetical protein
VARGLAHRPAFGEALAWLEVFGDAADLVLHWREARRQRGPAAAEPDVPVEDAPTGGRRRRRRRRRRRGPKPGTS